MKKTKLYLSALTLSLAALAVGCTKKDNNNNASTGNNNNGNSNNNSWNWTGTAPLSLQIDGVSYVASNAYADTGLGYLTVVGNNSSDTVISVSVASMPTVGTIYNCPSPANFGISVQSTNGASYEAVAGGSIKITTLNSSYIEGQFFGTVKDPTNSSSKAISVTNGYFKVNL